MNKPIPSQYQPYYMSPQQQVNTQTPQYNQPSQPPMPIYSDQVMYQHSGPYHPPQSFGLSSHHPPIDPQVHSQNQPPPQTYPTYQNPSNTFHTSQHPGTLPQSSHAYQAQTTIPTTNYHHASPGMTHHQHPSYPQSIPNSYQQTQQQLNPSLPVPSIPNPLARQPQPPLPLIPDGVQPIDPLFISPTLNLFPNTNSLRKNTNTPLGIVLQPLAETDREIPTVSFGSGDIIRCKNTDCRCYINPFVTFEDRGGLWRCNLCHSLNNVPNDYYCALDDQNQRTDRFNRHELCQTSYDILASVDYVRRTPPPPSYVFLVDVSAPGITRGILNIISATLKDILKSLPSRSQIAFITFDHQVHFFKLSGQSPVVLSISSLDNPILPAAYDDLLVHVSSHIDVLNTLFDSLPSLYTPEHCSFESCYSSALKVAIKLLKPTGGRILSFISSLPSLSVGVLKNREDLKLLGTDQEHSLLNLSTDFYQQLAIKSSYDDSISFDLFLFPENYLDVSTLSPLCRYSSGSLYYYPSFKSVRDSKKFFHDLHHNLLRFQGFEGVMRIRTTPGIRCRQFFGNYFMSGQNYLSLPTVNSNMVYSVSLTYDDKILLSDRCYIQMALLYSNVLGEKLIRIHNLVIPTTDHITHIYPSINLSALINLIAKEAIEVVYKKGFQECREFLRITTLSLLRSFRFSTSNKISFLDESVFPLNLCSFPLLMLGLIKSLPFRSGNDVRCDERSAYLQFLNNMNLYQLETFVRPRLMRVDDLSNQEGLFFNNQYVLPGELSISMTSLSSSSAVLLDNGLIIILRIGRQVNEKWLQSIFGNHLRSLQGVDSSQLILQNPPESDTTSPLRRLTNIISYLTSLSSTCPPVHIIIEGERMEISLFHLLIEDKVHNVLSYPDWLRHIDGNTQ